MKKKSKVIGKDYNKLEQENLCDRIDYYGLTAKDGRIKIDTKRYKKFFAIPDSKIENRHSVYYLPTKQHRADYKCNWFRDLLAGYKQLWFREYKSFIDSIKTPKQVEDNARLSYLSDGVLEYDEANAKAFVADLVSKFTAGTKSIAAGAYDDEAKTITVTVSGVDASGLNQNVEVVLSGVKAASEANDDSAYDVTWTGAAVTKLEAITDYETLEFTGVGVTGTLTTSDATLSSTSVFSSTEGLTIAIDSVKLGSYTVDLAADAE